VADGLMVIDALAAELGGGRVLHHGRWFVVVEAV
jgi:hypothetical protein